MNKRMEYGTSEDPDFDMLEMLLDVPLNRIATTISNKSNINVAFFKKEKMKKTPRKGYTAKGAYSLSQVYEDQRPGKKLADVTLILFSQGDGTGDEKHGYSSKDFLWDKISSSVRHKILIPNSDGKTVPAKYVPRIKDCQYEVMFPVVSIAGNHVRNNCVSLKEIGANRVTSNGSETKHGLIDIGTLGIDGIKYRNMNRAHEYNNQHSEHNETVEVFATTGYKLSGNAFGRNHAIVYPAWYGRNMQIAGFMPVETKNQNYEILKDAFDWVSLPRI